MTNQRQDLSFNLCTKAWLPAMYLDGSVREISLKTAFEEAGSIKELSGDIPEQVLPVYRMMLAILYRAYPLPEGDDRKALLDTWKEVWHAGKFDMESIGQYIDYFKDRFDLFDSEHPFYQTPGLVYAGKDSDGVGELVADVPKDDKYLFAMRDKGTLESLSCAEAARWLVFQQSYATAGIKPAVVGNTHAKSGKVYAPKGSVGTGMLGAEGGIFLEGHSLFETLMLNWVLYDSNRKSVPIVGDEEDIPAWEMDSRGFDLQGAKLGEPRGPVSAYTWQSRRMRLVPSENEPCVVGVISCYGDIPSVLNADTAEPMTAWRRSDAQQKRFGLPVPPRMPQIHDPSRSIWRGLSSIVAVEGDDLRPGVVRWAELLRSADAIDDHDLPIIAIHAQGMSYGTQSSVFSDAIDDVLDLSSVLLCHDAASCKSAVEVVGLADQSVGVLVNFISNMQRAAGDKAGKDAARTEREKVREFAYSELDTICRNRLAHFPSSQDEAHEFSESWKQEIHYKLLSIADAFVQSSQRSFFDEHEGMTAGRAAAILHGSLNKILGRPKSAAGSDAAMTDAKGA